MLHFCCLQDTDSHYFAGLSHSRTSVIQWSWCSGTILQQCLLTLAIGGYDLLKYAPVTWEYTMYHLLAFRMQEHVLLMQDSCTSLNTQANHFQLWNLIILKQIIFNLGFDGKFPLQHNPINLLKHTPMTWEYTMYHLLAFRMQEHVLLMQDSCTSLGFRV